MQTEKGTVDSVTQWYARDRPDRRPPLGFMNVGYWRGVEDSLELAQINLMETLISFLTRKNGTVLDVACGKGATTKYLTKYFDPKKIVGINISEVQLQICRTIAPECEFRSMDATKLGFGDASFDNVLCIEAAHHFMTRQRFFEEAYRVLTPGGRLAMHDIIVHRHDCFDELGAEDLWPKDAWPIENCLPDLDAYREQLLEIGFNHVRTEDVTDLSWTPYMKYLVMKAEREFDRNRDYEILEREMRALLRSPWSRGHSTWCLAYAIK